MTAVHDAFTRLRGALQGGAASSEELTEELGIAPFDRLRRVLQSRDTTPLDLAVLVRHALRCEEAQSGHRPSVVVPHAAAWPTVEQWRSTGVDAVPHGAGLALTARPWRPAWLRDVPTNGVDGNAAGERDRSGSIRRPPADPFLRSFEHDRYRSAGQQAVLRASLATPPGGTLVVSLPTGEGKSLIFHALARFGFVERSRGVTLVVTPTVALALDHERSAQRLRFSDESFAYRADDPANRLLADRIRVGEQTLCFASPEAVCSPLLTGALKSAASRGLLRAIVVDEAHLIDSWGINFRPDFQVLAGLRRRLLEACPPGEAFRTLLLSATLTADTIETLRGLFPAHKDAEFGVASASRLRPEIEYWMPDDDGQQEERVKEALLHLPRPAILYVTERAAAERWRRRLRDLGFGRLGMVTGDSTAAERQEVIDGWSSGTIDLVVGTSAFGLGIDNRYVRAVVHACIPETLDRFYQEVGRGGRDGHASVSLIVPNERDRGIARSLSHRRLLSVEKGYPRWRSMFTSRLKERGADSPDRFRVPVDVRPGVDAERIDMVGPRNTGWNVRALVLLAAAGAIELEGIDERALESVEATVDTSEDEPGAAPESAATAAPAAHQFIDLRVIDTRHLDPAYWEREVEAYRRRQDAASRASLTQLEEFLRGQQCAADILAPLYTVAAREGMPELPVARACGGCPACRRTGRMPYVTEPAPTRWPWRPPAVPARLQELVPNGHLLVCVGTRRSDALERGREVEALGRLVGGGVRNIVELSGELFTADEVAAAAPSPCFVSRSLVPRDLPPGPTLILGGRGTGLMAGALEPRSPDDARIWVLPHGVDDPRRAGGILCDLPPGMHLTIREFVARFAQ